MRFCRGAPITKAKEVKKVENGAIPIAFWSKSFDSVD
jgi:hypothetical protein